jgi:hypothetical protein
MVAGQSLGSRCSPGSGHCGRRSRAVPHSGVRRRTSSSDACKPLTLAHWISVFARRPSLGVCIVQRREPRSASLRRVRGRARTAVFTGCRATSAHHAGVRGAGACVDSRWVFDRLRHHRSRAVPAMEGDRPRRGRPDTHRDRGRWISKTRKRDFTGPPGFRTPSLHPGRVPGLARAYASARPRFAGVRLRTAVLAGWPEAGLQLATVWRRRRTLDGVGRWFQSPATDARTGAGRVPRRGRPMADRSRSSPCARTATGTFG